VNLSFAGACCNMSYHHCGEAMTTERELTDEQCDTIRAEVLAVAHKQRMQRDDHHALIRAGYAAAIASRPEREPVPREPTQVMIAAGEYLAFSDHWDQLGIGPRDIWLAMHDAHPLAAQEGE
jgi:hypothetical protein